MKKIFLTLIVCALCGAMSAQNQDEERAARMKERQQKQTETLIKDLKLTDEQETTFREIYTRYQAELATTVQVPTQDEQTKSQSKKKELTEAEATTQLNAYFEKQAAQVASQQQRLEIQKKYLPEFSALLTPQQVLKIYQPTRQNQDRNRNNRGGYPGDDRGGFGGGDFQAPPSDFGGGGGFGGPGF